MGSVTPSVGYLVVGTHLDDGRNVTETSKYRKYEELRVKMGAHPTLLNEAEFLGMVGAWGDSCMRQCGRVGVKIPVP